MILPRSSMHTPISTSRSVSLISRQLSTRWDASFGKTNLPSDSFKTPIRRPTKWASEKPQEPGEGNGFICTNAMSATPVVSPADAPVRRLYLLTSDINLIIAGFILQGLFGDALYGQNPSYLCERFPTEVRATASGFVYHQGAIWGGLVAPVLSYFAIEMKMGFALPMMVSTTVFLVLVIIAVALGPETKGKRLTADLEVIKAAD